MTKILKKLLPASIIQFLKKIKHNNYKLISYSQEGEDLILSRIYEQKSDGFYVDVGAHHPVRFSNTYLFYKKGWRGINIDAMPGSMKSFKKLRPRDINIEQPISSEEMTMNYYVFNEPALNGFSNEISEQRHNPNGEYKIEKMIPLKTKRLENVLNNHMSDKQVIDFLSVDVEGLDLEVLKSNNWDKYRPNIVIAEILENDLIKISDNEVAKFLNSVGYDFYAKSVNSCFFKKRSD